MRRLAIIASLVLPLAACGSDGGGGVSSTPAPPTPSPTPTPTPSPTPTPAPTNTNITSLTASQTFANDAAKSDLTINLTSKTSGTGAASPTSLTVRYDASTASYLVTSGGITDTFSPADQASSGGGEVRYIRRSAGSSSYLTLVTTPYTGTVSNRYVGLGYLQRNSTSSDQQTTAFTTFTYGLDTPASGVPRTGTGSFTTDVFGLETLPGSEPAVFQGQGNFNVDFLNGLFSTDTYLTRTGLISSTSISGGTNELKGGGHLSAADGTFSGDVVYTSGPGLVSLGGQLNGRFYGPGSDEVGASFGGSSTDGRAFNGSLTGQRNTGPSSVNISFASLVAPQLFYGDATTISVRTPKNGGAPAISDYPGPLNVGSVSRVQFTDQTGGNVQLSTPTSNLAGGSYTVSTMVAGDPLFTTYEMVSDGQPTKLELYKTGTANKELALTYASFGRYSTTSQNDAAQTQVDRVFFVYGFDTPSGLFGNRTGSASYAGVAYGTGADTSGTLHDVTGSSTLTVDFTRQSMSGALTLSERGGSSIDSGSFAFAGQLAAYQSQGTGTITRAGGADIGSLMVNFYGPSAEEAAGLFRLRVPDGVGANTLIDGAMLAKKK